MDKGGKRWKGVLRPYAGLYSHLYFAEQFDAEL